MFIWMVVRIKRLEINLVLNGVLVLVWVTWS